MELLFAWLYSINFQRKNMTHRCILLALVFVANSPSSLAFSAQLSRPWEARSTLSTSLVRRRKRWNDSVLHQSTSSAQDNKDDPSTDDASTSETDHVTDDAMLLQTKGDDLTEGAIAAQSHPSTHNAVPISSSSTSATIQEESTVWSSLPLLFQMTRPSNFPGVVLLHILGVYLALQSPLVGNEGLWPTLARPSMLIVLMCLLLTSSASMVVNDYFDNQIGVDKDIQKPLVGGTVTMAVVKQFLYYIYAALALLMTAVPGVPARLMVVIGNMLTYWYTKHLKPITWLKNVVCATVMGISPATSGAAAFHLLSTQNSFRVFGVASLSRLVLTLFCGFLGREILMDINDVDDDMAQNVKTVPVAHGRKFASKAALVSTAVMATCASMGPLWKLGQSIGSTVSWGALVSTLCSCPGGATRQLVFASLGCIPQLWRAWNVCKTEGEDRPIVEQAVDEGKLTFMLILASFV